MNRRYTPVMSFMSLYATKKEMEALTSKAEQLRNEIHQLSVLIKSCEAIAVDSKEKLEFVGSIGFEGDVAIGFEISDEQKEDFRVRLNAERFVVPERISGMGKDNDEEFGVSVMR
ncbi:hypothetical protein F511_37919 [Dorcoceras hygrometricum]|uniref:Uncharacterized protein n=1 Tax=Dorcoceras hygrometricum TaxID=472368 RepID=A0A2Z7CUS7_9LAMI|nr:hypothetical protein F511_37919 [Dorcoceras hygrometricum]